MNITDASSRIKWDHFLHLDGLMKGSKYQAWTACFFVCSHSVSYDKTYLQTGTRHAETKIIKRNGQKLPISKCRKNMKNIYKTTLDSLNTNMVTIWFLFASFWVIWNTPTKSFIVGHFPFYSLYKMPKKYPVSATFENLAISFIKACFCM